MQEVDAEYSQSDFAGVPDGRGLAASSFPLNSPNLVLWAFRRFGVCVPSHWTHAQVQNFSCIRCRIFVHYVSGERLGRPILPSGSTEQTQKRRSPQFDLDQRAKPWNGKNGTEYVPSWSIRLGLVVKPR